ncbi:MAG: sigma-E processing peptidase SpoIIGA [Oscillospiraceae bacterium]|nr:sigma-E processing peptidase SpoIIGA [Oscillospiraceae bacterium]
MTIYIDILIITNIIINYFLLLLTTKFCLYKPKRKNILLASIVGGIYSLVNLLPELSFIFIFLLKLISCFIMTLILFEFKNKNLLKNYYIFFIINFIFSGLMMTFWFFISPVGMNINNGVVYFNISTITLIISILIAYIIINIFVLITKKVPIEIKDYLVEVYINNQKIKLKGFVDTGNFLCDIFSATPVVICKFDSISSILPTDIKKIILNNNINNINFISKYNLRLIPYKTISNQEFIIALRPEKFVLINNNKYININDVYIGLVLDTDLLNKNYDIILNPRLIK